MLQPEKEKESTIDIELKNIHDEINSGMESSEGESKEKSSDEVSQILKNFPQPRRLNPYSYENFQRKFLIFEDPLFKKSNSRLQNILVYIFLILKMLLTSIGVIIFWVGSWNFLDNYLLPHSIWSEFGCIIVGGILFLILTVIYEIPFLKNKSGYLGYVIYTIRDIIASFLVVVIWKGIYNIFDTHLLQGTLMRSFVYIIIGVIVMVLSGNIGENTNL